jgi:hypothetical protein
VQGVRQRPLEHHAVPLPQGPADHPRWEEPPEPSSLGPEHWTRAPPETESRPEVIPTITFSCPIFIVEPVMFGSFRSANEVRLVVSAGPFLVAGRREVPSDEVADDSLEHVVSKVWLFELKVHWKEKELLGMFWKDIVILICNVIWGGYVLKGQWVGDQNLLSRAPLCFRRLLSCRSSFKEGWHQAGGQSSK